MLYNEFLEGTQATEGKQSYNAYKAIEALYMASETMTKQEAYAIYNKPTRNRAKAEKVNDITIQRFNSFDDFSEFMDNKEEYEYDELVIITENNQIAVDLQTECKSYKTAINRFFQACASIPEFEGWEESILESCGNGYFQEASTIWNSETCRSEYTGDYAWQVEATDENLWYITLKVRA